MKERPILFSAPMVRAILEGRKTQTRRVVKPQHIKFFEPSMDVALERSPTLATAFCPYGQPGDRLWVRETHMLGLEADIEVGAVAYRADGYVRGGLGDFELRSWRPSIHMPRWASRILLEVTGVRVERLQDISDRDIEAEGTNQWVKDGGNVWSPRPGFDGEQPNDEGKMTVKPNRVCFCSMWESINGVRSWDANPWVWVVAFKSIGGAA